MSSLELDLIPITLTLIHNCELSNIKKLANLCNHHFPLELLFLKAEYFIAYSRKYQLWSRIKQWHIAIILIYKFLKRFESSSFQILCFWKCHCVHVYRGPSRQHFALTGCPIDHKLFPKIERLWQLSPNVFVEILHITPIFYRHFMALLSSFEPLFIRGFIKARLKQQ